MTHFDRYLVGLAWPPQQPAQVTPGHYDVSTPSRKLLIKGAHGELAGASNHRARLRPSPPATTWEMTQHDDRRGARAPSAGGSGPGAVGIELGTYAPGSAVSDAASMPVTAHASSSSEVPADTHSADDVTLRVPDEHPAGNRYQHPS